MTVAAQSIRPTNILYILVDVSGSEAEDREGSLARATREEETNR